LSGRFDGELGMWVHAAFKVMPGIASDNSSKIGGITRQSS
jgi:hypothetical protein